MMSIRHCSTICFHVLINVFGLGWLHEVRVVEKMTEEDEVTQVH